MNTLKIFTILFFVTLLQSCHKKSENPVPESVHNSEEDNTAYFFKYSLNGADFNFKNGLQDFGLKNEVFKQAGGVTVTEYRGGLFKRDAQKVTTLSFGVGEVGSAKAEAKSKLIDYFKVGTYGLEYYGNTANDKYYFIEYLSSEVNINGSKVKTYLPKSEDGTNVTITRVKDLGIIEETFMNEVTRTYAVAVEGKISSVRLYEYNNGFISGGDIKYLKDVNFKVMVKSMISPKKDFLEDFENEEDLNELIK
ncbi:MAG TPA: hypothetical protein VF691_01415 [Cytophagaceae bacterium]|jgi:hypothetical protein